MMADSATILRNRWYVAALATRRTPAWLFTDENDAAGRPETIAAGGV